VDLAIKEPPSVRGGPTVSIAGNTTTPLAQPGVPFWWNQEIDTFIVADENAFVGCNIVNYATTDPFVDNYISFWFYGQFLEKTGVPANFQVANKAGQAYSADTVSPSTFADVAPDGTSGADFLVRRRRSKDPFARIPLVNTPK
jgi:hypothetical protein